MGKEQIKVEYIDSIGRVASDFQARTSAMSTQGASAYADNWN